MYNRYLLSKHLFYPDRQSRPDTLVLHVVLYSDGSHCGTTATICGHSTILEKDPRCQECKNP